ncbi:MAG TPA: P63C domain-containing protein [Mucilaginibacter sp.]|nr:P63C domain-containing protein [Mucilaginibacter sp.]
MKELELGSKNVKNDNIIKAKYEGILKLSEDGEPINVAVLEDGTRLIGRNEIFRAFGRTKRGRALNENRAENLPSFIDAKNLQPFIKPELYDILLNPIKCKTLGGPIIDGYKAEILPLLCDAYLDADKDHALIASQKPLARMSLIIVRSLSKIGIIALIDEATGYQFDREKDELQKILRAYIAEELLPWQKRFPDEFYQEIFRLNGWDYTVNGIQNRPGVIGTWTKKLIYNLLPKGVLEELEKRTPVSDSGNKTKRLHQSLTLDIGEPHLEKQLISVITLMNISSDWDEFLRLFGKKFQKDLMQLSVQPQFKKSSPKVSAKQYLMFGQKDLFGNPVAFDSKGKRIEIVEEKEEKLSDFNTKLTTALNYNPKNKE